MTPGCCRSSLASTASACCRLAPSATGSARCRFPPSSTARCRPAFSSSACWSLNFEFQPKRISKIIQNMNNNFNNCRSTIMSGGKPATGRKRKRLSLAPGPGDRVTARCVHLHPGCHGSPRRLRMFVRRRPGDLIGAARKCPCDGW